MRAPKNAKISSRGFSFGTIFFSVEETLEEYEHACTLVEIEELIKKLPEKDAEGLSLVIFHQPTRKAEMASPRWAAYNYDYSYGKISGPTIFLEAVNPLKQQKWTTSLTPEDKRELEHLQDEGHHVVREKNSFFISMDIPSVKRTQLERSFIHEVGHHVDYKNNRNHFCKKTKLQKEAFANKYLFQVKQGW